jgi:hypothetical protein
MVEEHEHHRVKSGIHVPIAAVGDGYEARCVGDENCHWSFSHPDISACRAEAIHHLEHDPHG